MGKEFDKWVRQARDKWQFRGKEKPSIAIEPNAWQESVWDYPRPPKLERDRRLITVSVNGKVIAESNSAIRALETASPPTFYIPPKDVDETTLTLGSRFSLCEWKGVAQYWNVNFNTFAIEGAAWYYLDPYQEFESIAGYFSFYPHRLSCYIDRELARPQPGKLYGGWITNEIIGPFKGNPGTENW